MTEGGPKEAAVVFGAAVTVGLWRMLNPPNVSLGNLMDSFLVGRGRRCMLLFKFILCSIFLFS